MRLKNKVAFITGACGGMGWETSLKFAKEGAAIAAADLNMDSLSLLVKEIQALGGTAIAVELNVAEESSVKKAIACCIEKLGGLDILINYAGITQSRKFEEMTVEEWDRVLTINLRGSFLTSNTAFRYMKDNGGGKIINISSAAIYGGGGHIGTAHYTASKAGVVGLSKAIAKEGAAYGILCNAICPGLTRTGMTNNFLATSEKTSAQGIPLGRVGAPEDLANAAVFLASDESSYITGLTLDVNGGLVMK